MLISNNDKIKYDKKIYKKYMNEYYYKEIYVNLIILKKKMMSIPQLKVKIYIYYYIQIIK